MTSGAPIQLFTTLTNPQLRSGVRNRNPWVIWKEHHKILNHHLNPKFLLLSCHLVIRFQLPFHSFQMFTKMDYLITQEKTYKILQWESLVPNRVNIWNILWVQVLWKEECQVSIWITGVKNPLQASRDHLEVYYHKVIINPLNNKKNTKIRYLLELIVKMHKRL